MQISGFACLLPELIFNYFPGIFRKKKTLKRVKTSKTHGIPAFSMRWCSIKSDLCVHCILNREKIEIIKDTMNNFVFDLS